MTSPESEKKKEVGALWFGRGEGSTVDSGLGFWRTVQGFGGRREMSRGRG